jgi:hypothetical protein
MDKLQGKVKLVSLNLLRNLGENIGDYVVSNIDRTVYKLNGFSNGYYKIEDSMKNESMKAQMDLINNFSSIFITCDDFYDPECQVLFKINGEYLISSPLDFMGNQIEEADQIFAFSYQIGKDMEGNDLNIGDIQNMISSLLIYVAIEQNTFSDGLVVQSPILIDGKITIDIK